MRRSFTRYRPPDCFSSRRGVSPTTCLRERAAAPSRPNGSCDRMKGGASNGGAWCVTPGDYLAKRPAAFRLSQPISQYVTMRDDCRLAVDAYVPQAVSRARTPATFPTIVFFTPYYRRFKLRPGGVGEANPNTGKFRDFFVPRGYAVVVVDVRGTGASFGTRDSFRSPRERDDSREIADWIVAQRWSKARSALPASRMSVQLRISWPPPG